MHAVGRLPAAGGRRLARRDGEDRDGTRRPASRAIAACARAATSASLTPGCASSLTARLDDVGEPRGAPDRLDLDRQLDAARGTTSSSTATSSAPSARSTSATATGSDEASMPMRPGPPRARRSAASSSTCGIGRVLVVVRAVLLHGHGTARRVQRVEARDEQRRARRARAPAARGRPRTGSRRATPPARDRTGRGCASVSGWLSTARSRPASASAPRSRSISSCMTREPRRRRRPKWHSHHGCHLAARGARASSGGDPVLRDDAVVVQPQEAITSRTSSSFSIARAAKPGLPGKTGW